MIEKKELTEEKSKNFEKLFERELIRIYKRLSIKDEKGLILIGLRKRMSDKYSSLVAKEHALKAGMLEFHDLLDPYDEEIKKGLEKIQKLRPDIFYRIIDILQSDF